MQGFLDAERKMNVKQWEPEREPILSSIQVTDKPIRSGDIKVFMFGADNKLGTSLDSQIKSEAFMRKFQAKRGMKNTFQVLKILLIANSNGRGVFCSQGSVYNFLERPTGWTCFVYHFSV